MPQTLEHGLSSLRHVDAFWKIVCSCLSAAAVLQRIGSTIDMSLPTDFAQHHA